MSNRCVHCNEAWDFDDFVCPVCDRHAVEMDSDMEPTLKYEITPIKKNIRPDFPSATFEYDVIRISTGKSIWD